MRRPGRPFKNTSAQKRKQQIENSEAKTSNAFRSLAQSNGGHGADGSGGAAYGELRKGGENKLHQCLIKYCGAGPRSRMLDIGSGCGRVVARHAQHGAAISGGIELIRDRAEVSYSAHRRMINDEGKRGIDQIWQTMSFMQGDASAAKTFDPFTIVYEFDLAVSLIFLLCLQWNYILLLTAKCSLSHFPCKFDPAYFQAISPAFNNSKTCQYFISYKKPGVIIEEYHFNVELHHKETVNMTGTQGEGKTCYFYKRIGRSGPGGTEKLSNGWPCDPLFREMVETVLAGPEAVKKRCEKQCEYLDKPTYRKKTEVCYKGMC